MRYVFADCVLDTQRCVLSRDGRVIALRPKVFRVLWYLLTQPARVVPKHEVAAQVWPDSFTSDAVIESTIKAVRQALGDSGRTQRYIQTLRGYGYRVVVEVTVCPEAAADGDGGAAAAPEAPPLPDRTRCRVCHHPARAEAVFCEACGQPLADTGAGDGIPPCADAGHTPPPVGMPAGERKVVTVLCCGLPIPPSAQARLDLDALHQQMRRLSDLARQAVQQYGGTLLPVVGDRCLALFGAPVAQEDHAQRAALAALALHQQVAAQQEAFPGAAATRGALGIGMHTGVVGVGGLGEAQDTASALVGETALAAIALYEAAAPGTILCSPATARLVHGVGQLDPGPSVPAGSHQTPMAVYTLRARRSINPWPHAPETRTWRCFVGRRQELTTLRALLAQVHTSRGQVVGIVGEPGIGKSRLLAEWRQRIADRALTYLEGRCLSYRQGTPLHLVRALLRQICALPEAAHPAALTAQVHRCLQEMAMVVADDAPYLLHLLDVPGAADGLPTLSPHARTTRTLAIVLQLLLRKSQQAPLVIAVEDLQWIDATSEAWLTALVDQLAGAPLLLLATYRPGYRPPWLDKSYATQLALQPLTPRDSRQIVQAIVASDQVPAPLVQRLLALADGNPFFLEELAYTVLEQGTEQASWRIPETIQAVLTARIDRLPPTAKHVLHLAAVMGKDVPLSLLEAVAALPAPTLQQGLQHLQAAEFLLATHGMPTPAYTFKHVLTQEMAYASLLPCTRQAYHQRIAQALTAEFPDIVASQPELVAHHAMAAGLHGQAVGYWHQAGQRAVQRSAHVEAIHHFRRGLEALSALPVTPERTAHELRIQIALGASLMTTQGFASPEAADAYTRAHALCQEIGDSPQLLPVLQGLWRWYFARGQVRQAKALAEQLLAVPQPQHDPARQVGGHNALGMSLFLRGELLPARTHLEHVMTRYDPQQHHALAFLYGQDPGVVCLTHMALVLWALGYPAQAVQRSQEALTLARTLAHPFSLAMALAQMAFVHQLRRAYQEAGALAEELITLASEQGFPLWLAAGTSQQGWARVWQEQDEAGGIAQMCQGIAAWRATGAAMHLPHALAKLAEAYAKAGRIEDGLTVLAEAFRLVEAHEERYYAAELHRLMGTLLQQRSADPHTEAEACFHQARAIARQQQARLLELRATVSLGRLWHQQGQHAAARRMLIEVYDWFTEGFDTVDLQEAKTLLEEIG